MNVATKCDDFAAATEVNIGDGLARGVVTGIRASTSGRSAWFTMLGANGERELAARIRPGPHDGVLAWQSGPLVRGRAATGDAAMGNFRRRSHPDPGCRLQSGGRPAQFAAAAFAGRDPEPGPGAR